MSYELRNFAVTLRLWRLIALERFVPAFGDFLEADQGAQNHTSVQQFGILFLQFEEQSRSVQVSHW